jgi:pimeloyl-ACP methyl ester carboxylesterase
VFVPGWVSVVEGWADLLRVLVPGRRVLYVETREKRSARLPRLAMAAGQFSLPRQADDLIAVCRLLEGEQGKALIFGSSLGSNVILEALKGGRLEVRGAFLVGPNREFAFGGWGRLLLCLPASSYHLVKYFVLWYLRTFRIDARREPEQMARYERTLRAADPLRLKLSAKAVVHYDALPGLETITAPVAIACAVSDTLHGTDGIQALANRIPHGRVASCPSNRYMHGPEVANDLAELERSIG